MKKILLPLIIFVTTTGCQTVADLKGYNWTSDTDSKTFSDYGTSSENVDISGTDSSTDSVTISEADSGTGSPNGKDSESDSASATENDSHSETETHKTSEDSTDSQSEIDTHTTSDSATVLATDTTTETDTDTGAVVIACENGTHPACYGNAIWCVDTNESPVLQLITCGEDEHCDQDSGVRCLCNLYTQCYSGDVWQYSVCSGISNIIVDCDDTCEQCVNSDGESAYCAPLNVQSYQQCGADGNVHWFDSCGSEGDVVTTCENCQVCKNADDKNAGCVAKPDFNSCELITSPDRQYDICVAGTCVSPGCGTSDCNVPGPYFPLPDSGQRTCYDDTAALVSCPVSGEDYFGQDAQFGWDFAHEVDERYTVNLDFANQPIVIDNVTGLSWQGCTGGLDGADCDNPDSEATRMIWAEALIYCENLEWGGHADWRLPDEYALQTIVDSGASKPAVNEAAFPFTESSYYWASSSNAHYPSLGEAVYFQDGSVYYPAKEYGYYARCVRGDQILISSLERSTSPGEPVVTDSLNSLIWQGCSAGQTDLDCKGGGGIVTNNWKGALYYCESLSWAGYDDWRLPNTIELSSIVDNLVYSASINKDLFPETGSDSYWSSTVNSAYNAHAMYVNFDSGDVGSASKADSYSHIRCVRDVE